MKTSTKKLPAYGRRIARSDVPEPPPKEKWGDPYVTSYGHTIIDRGSDRWSFDTESGKLIKYLRYSGEDIVVSWFSA